MRDDVLDAQRNLVELVESTEWEVTDVDVSEYASPWEEGDDPEATVEITARRMFAGFTDSDPAGENPYRKN